jgi:hypothetical protein
VLVDHLLGAIAVVVVDVVLLLGVVGDKWVVCGCGGGLFDGGEMGIGMGVMGTFEENECGSRVEFHGASEVGWRG